MPETPAGLAEKAQDAIDADDDVATMECAKEITRAHSQYRAEFDVKGWLFDFRNSISRPHRADTTKYRKQCQKSNFQQPQRNLHLQILQLPKTGNRHPMRLSEALHAPQVIGS
jgi:hypothetical protein